MQVGRKLCRTGHNHSRYDNFHYNIGPENYPLKFSSAYSSEPEADTVAPVSSLGASSVYIPERSVRDVLVDFCDRTSSHGIPHIASSPTAIGKTIWTVVFLICSVVFIIQTYLTIRDYRTFRTVIQIEMKFESPPFPAVTVCNLNPYKNGSLFALPEVLNAYMQYKEAIRLSKMAKSTGLNRPKRQVNYEPVYARCRCLFPEQECVYLYYYNDPDHTTCLCFEETHSGDVWPCYQASLWKKTKCANCSLTNSCDMPQQDEPDGVPCLCQRISNKCLRLLNDDIRWWYPTNYTSYEVTLPGPTSPPPATAAPVDMTNSPFDPSKDNPITAVARLNTRIRSIVALLDEFNKANLSYRVDELVMACSFNNDRCDIEKDFIRRNDTTYGNCYTFNYNISEPFRNTRAGPVYGLRLLLNVDQNSYLPFTEAAGVRIVVHDQDHYPFPDTFGFSAPVGVASSFGLKRQMISRLGAPYSTCKETEKDSYYLFDESYSTEGCYRSCLQKQNIELCGCGDAKYPVGADQRICNHTENFATSCLLNFTSQFSKMPNFHGKCGCVQPCNETTYQTSYSAASWPAIRFNISDECPEDVSATNSCQKYFRTNTALIEIYYEQLSYENLVEVEAYALINLLSDFGGNIGLWIGFSAITFVEFFELGFEFLKLCFNRVRARRRKRLCYSNPVVFQYVNRAVEENFDDSSSVDISGRYSLAKTNDCDTTTKL